MKTPKQYIDSLKGDRKEEIKHLHDLIHKEAPKLKPFLYDNGSGAIIGYGKYAYETKSGCTGDWFVIGLSSRKQYISLYVMCTKNGKYLAETYKKRLPKANIGKGCVRFKTLSDVSESMIKKLVQEAAKFGPCNPV